MKIYLAASKRGKEKFGENYKLIYDRIEKLGHKNLNDFVIREDSKEFYDNLKKDGTKKYTQIFNYAISNMREADVNIFECSEQSFSIGYLVQKSIEMNKPTIVLYEEQYQPSYFLLGSEDEKLVIKNYNKENLEKTLEAALQTATSVADKRFNFFITPSMISFLNQAAREQGITKSTLIRNLILEHRKKNSRS